MLCKNPFVRKSTGITRINIVTSEDARLGGQPFPCGQCLPCKINKARVWTHRILLEQQTSTSSAFVTLTYNEEHKPDELKPIHLQKFIKRLRKYIYPQKIRYYAVGEYGEKTLRPHYHLALFNLEHHNLRYISTAWSPNGIELGYSYIGDLNEHSARYITGYITNKIYRDFDERLLGKQKEFMRCSKQNGGIGSQALKQIAKKLNSSPHYEKQVVKTLTYGKKELPLGGYLTRKLSEQLENEENLNADNRSYYDSLFSDHLTSDTTFLHNLTETYSQKRLNQEKKFNIYRKRNTL